MNDLFMDGMAIFNFAITEVHKNVNSLIEYMDWVKEDVGFYALHQSGALLLITLLTARNSLKHS